MRPSARALGANLALRASAKRGCSTLFRSLRLYRVFACQSCVFHQLAVQWCLA